jgi:hypothetical protein
VQGDIALMSKSEILAELPQRSAVERAEILDQLWKIEEASGPTEREKTLLDEAQASYESDPSPGAPWQEVARADRNG